MEVIFCSRISIFWQLWGDDRSGFQCLDGGIDSLHGQIPLVVGQCLRQLGLFDLQLLQPVLKLLDACAVYRQVLVDL